METLMPRAVPQALRRWRAFAYIPLLAVGWWAVAEHARAAD